jgi:hypothetical protein
MQFHALEMAHVAATARTGLGRCNFYVDIHKALRTFMAETLLTVGRTDPTDPTDHAELTRTVAQVGELMALCASHVAQEHDVSPAPHRPAERSCAGPARRTSAKRVCTRRPLPSSWPTTCNTCTADDGAKRDAFLRFRTSVLTLRNGRHNSKKVK